MQHTIAIIAGSNRREATSTKLCKYIHKVLVEQGFQVELIDLFENPIPFYCPDDDQHGDANLSRMIQTVREADAIVLATPEYHGSVSGVLKNALDHMGSDEFNNKPVLAVSSSGGAVGVSSLSEIQTIVRNVHGINCPEWISIGGEQRRLTVDGVPANPQIKDRVHRVLLYFAGFIEKLVGGGDHK